MDARRGRLSRARTSLLFGATVMAWGCQPANPTGVLGNGGFAYVCSGQEGDSACAGTSETTTLPGAVAVGAKFQLDYTPKSNADTQTQGATGYEVVPASSELALATSNTIVAEKPGYVALLARHVGTADVDDFVFLKFATITAVKPSTPSVALTPGATASVAVTAHDALGAELAGQLACTWSSSDPGVVTVAATTGLGSLTAGCAAGTATVTATCGGGAVVLPVTVSSGGCGGDASDGGSNG